MSELTKAQKLRARREMVRQKQQDAIEKRDIKTNAIRSENIMRRKNAAKKMGKTFSYGSTVTPSAEGGPLNYGSPMKKSCIKMYDEKGKQTGLMMEGSVAQMETIKQEKKNLMSDMPIDNRGVGQMSPYKMDHPGESGEKSKKELTEAQKLKMAGEAIGKDVSFEVKTIEDPRSSRSIVKIKKQLKKENPKQYKNIYGS